MLVSQADREGTFVLSQFRASCQQLEFIQNIVSPRPTLTVVEIIPTVKVIKTNDDLLAGTEQEVELVIRTGSRAFHEVFLPAFSI